MSTTSSNEMFSSCWPSSALVAGVNSGSSNLLASVRPGGSAMPHDLAGLLVVDQSRAGQVAAGHALHRHHLQLAHHQRAAQHLVGDALVVGRPGEVVGRLARSRRRTRSSRSGCGPCRGSRCPGCSRTPRCGRWRRTAGGRRRCGRAREPCRWPDAGSRTERGASGQPSGRCCVGIDGMTSRYVPYATTPARLLAQLISDVVVAVWTVIWVLVGMAVHSAVSDHRRVRQTRGERRERDRGQPRFRGRERRQRSADRRRAEQAR